MTTPNFQPEVAIQYENYPYPERNPDKEKKHLYTPMLDCLDRVNYYCFEGKKHFDNDFRVLVAGGGTGDTAIFLAGSGRSGTTWLSNIIAAMSGTQEIFEPLHPLWNKEFCIHSFCSKV